MARGPTKKERGSQQEDKKKEASPPQGPMNNTHATQEAWMAGNSIPENLLRGREKGSGGGGRGS
jgi:uncharacterized protein (DUF2126 family)